MTAILSGGRDGPYTYYAQVGSKLEYWDGAGLNWTATYQSIDLARLLTVDRSDGEKIRAEYPASLDKPEAPVNEQCSPAPAEPKPPSSGRVGDNNFWRHRLAELKSIQCERGAVTRRRQRYIPDRSAGVRRSGDRLVRWSRDSRRLIRHWSRVPTRGPTGPAGATGTTVRSGRE